ncbi:MAG TPA: MFS transporter [Candidatus Coprenecus merdigallinarum]|nr:MFS transporter [Candidatus Coprenecus merdigallinarum]
MSTTQTVKKNYALPIAMMYLLFFMIAFVTNLCNPMAVIVKNQFEVSNAMAQLGNAANFIAYAVMGIPAGILLKRIGYKKTALLAIVVGFLGVFLQYVSGWNSVQSYGVYLAGAFIAGFCMCMLNTVVNPMLNTLGGGGKRGNQLIQFGGVGNSLAATFVTIFVGALVGDAAKAQISDATPALFIALGIFLLVFIVLSFVKIPEPDQEGETVRKPAVSPTGKRYSAFSFRHFNLGIIAIFLYMGVEVGIPTYVLQYLSTAADAATPGFGMDSGIAASIAGVFWLMMLVGRLCGGLLGGRFSSRAQILFVSSVCVLFIVLGMLLPSSTTVPFFGFEGSTGRFVSADIPVGMMFLVLCGLCTSVCWGGIFNMAVEGLGRFTSVASGMFMTMVCGGGILIPLQGAIADASDSFLVSFSVPLVCAAYIFFYALIGYKNVNKDIVTD